MTRLCEIRVGQTYVDDDGTVYIVTKVENYAPALAVPRPANVHGSDVIHYEGVGKHIKGISSRADFANRMSRREEA